MNQRLPFYMIYDTENFLVDDRNNRNWGVWDDESMMRRDYEYMKSAYPDMAKRIMPYVEAECDRLEYSGSLMFDEYPDQLQMRLLCRRISRRIREQENKWKEGEWLEELIQVLVFHEIIKRRGEYRKYRRKFY